MTGPKPLPGQYRSCPAGVRPVPESAVTALRSAVRMNMVKRMMGRPRQDDCSPQDNALGLMHLRRLFSELCHPPRHMTQKEQEEKLYMMLPVFNRVFGNAQPSSMMDKFSDLLQFTTPSVQTHVTEIRRRASNKSTEAASRAIVQFLEVNQSEEASRGWMLLTTINLLASSGQHMVVSCLFVLLHRTGAPGQLYSDTYRPTKTVDCMTTMVRALHPGQMLIPVLRPAQHGGGFCGHGPSSAAPRPRIRPPDRATVRPTQSCLWLTAECCYKKSLCRYDAVKILVKLCTFVSPAEELAQKDDLQLLFSAITSWVSSSQPALEEERGRSAHHHLQTRPERQRGQVHPRREMGRSAVRMNMVKRMMGRPRQDDCSPQDNALGLMHLRRLFSELCHPPRHMTQKEQEEKLYMMLPVFNRVFGNAQPSSMMDKFSDLLQFTTQVSRLMVTEIRRRASNKSTENRGLHDHHVRALHLVKCLYLFFDLPNMVEASVGTAPPPPPPSQDKTPGQGHSQTHSELPLADRRVLLQKVFVQTTSSCCSVPSLPGVLLTTCPGGGARGEVLTTISRHGLSVNVVKYIHEKECLSTCVQNMQQSDDLSPVEIVEMFAGLSCFLKDSSDVSQTLLDDFRMCQGYTFLCDLLLRLEQAKEDECKDSLKDLVNLVTCLCTYGVSELKPAGLTTGAPFLLPGFVLPQPSGKGHTVRNIQAFSVLQNAFLRAKSSRLACMLLDAIGNIYAAEPSNYFILESQHTLSQLAERVAKLPDAQTKYFELLEFVVFSLNYVPCKELFSVSVLLKSSSSHSCSMTAVRTLLKLARHDPVFSDVLREVGLLEVLVNLLHKYAALLKEPGAQPAHSVEQGKTSTSDTLLSDTEYSSNTALLLTADGKRPDVLEEQKQLAWLVMETLTVLLQGSNTNAALFREFGGARCVHNIVKYRQCREHALLIIQQLVLSPSGDDDMGTLLGLMHSAPSSELQLKTDILRALLLVLRESHRTRTVFRKVGGFVYVTSLLVAMERCLCQPPCHGWERANQNQVFELLHTVFCTLTAAMRYEPANSTSSGPRSSTRSWPMLSEAGGHWGVPVQRPTLSEAPGGGARTHRGGDSVCPTLKHCSKLFIYLYKMATDSFDSRTEQLPPCLSQETSLPSPWGTPALTRKRFGYYGSSAPVKALTELKLHLSASPASHSSSSLSDTVVIHPGAVLAMLDLLPSVSSDSQPESGSGRRGAPATPPLQRMFERLASQALLPTPLREFLRLGDPLNCGAWDKKQLKQYRVHKPSSLSYDPDMRNSMTLSMEGFGPDSVFTTPAEDNGQYRISRSLVRSAEGSTVPLTRVKCLVSMTTPHDIRLHGSTVTPPFVEFDTSLEGFGGAPLPSSSGLSYSSWFCVERFSTAPQAHPLRLLTLVRRASSSEQHYVCLSVVLSAKDHCISVSTKEELLHTYSAEESSDESSFYELLPCCARFRCSELIMEGQWHHLLLVMSKGMLKNSMATLYLDGQLINTVKLHYIHSGPGGSGSTNPPVVSTVYAYIGTPPAQRQVSSLVWRLGPSHFLEEVLPASTVTTIYELGPNLWAASRQSTLHLAVSSHENATPVKLLHNAAGHLNGSARTLGAAVIGYLGVRAFVPRPVATSLQYVGGAAAILGLVAMASDVEDCTQRSKLWCLLAMLLKKKRPLLNSHILHLTFSLVGTVDSGHETSIIPNCTAFQDLLCDFEVWLHAPYELHLSLFEHFIELLTESSEAAKNAKLLREMGLIPRLLLTLRDPSLSQPTVGAISNVLSLLLQGFPNPLELLRACEEVVRTLGFDWLLMLMEEHLHSTTVTAALWILVVLLSNQSILHRFKEGLCGGGWLEHTDSVLSNKIGTVLPSSFICVTLCSLSGFNVGRSAGGRSTLREINREACHFPGFPVLQSLLPKHTNVPELYFLLMALFLQQPVPELPDSLQVHFDLDSIWSFIFGVPASSGTVVGSVSSVCTEAALLLLAMLRSMLNLPWQSEEEGSWLREYPVTLMQFFRYLYHNLPDLGPMWHSAEFLCALAATVFPFNIRPYSEMVSDLDDEAGSPTEEFKAFAGDSGMNRSQSEYCNVGSKTSLTNHPAKKYVLDFMRVLIMDNMCTIPATKQTPIWTCCWSQHICMCAGLPERSTRTQQKEFQSNILDGVMEHLLAADVLLGEDASLPLSTGGNYQTLVNNVFYFSQRVVDKLWQGMFNKDSKLVVDFIVQLIAQSKRRSQGLSLDSVYHCLNRTVLYQLSRPHKTVAQQVSLLDALRVLTVNRNLVLGPGNHDQEFVACLAHCFICLHTGSSVEGFGLEAEARMTTWHVNMSTESETDCSPSQDVSEGQITLTHRTRDGT
ncbi:hypothetical protein WMY93_012945 [Mugilogobius chulae]|uniref:Alfy-like armadillo-like repeat domain-containing protein n=1 Tax=Mugilogobius chulae TaxID=88201 RepID=A0AAW0P4P7_9GOBI